MADIGKSCALCKILPCVCAEFHIIEKKLCLADVLNTAELSSSNLYGSYHG